ncbi:Ig-like domain-containing protein [candidate division KSB1 bacterium]
MRSFYIKLFYTHKIEFALLLCFILLKCASQGPPSGGSVDNVPPEIVDVYPAAGATNIDTHTDIYLKFSEDMNQISVEKSIFITPLLAEELYFRWDGKRLNIRNKNGLQSGVTYVINVGTESKDLRNIKMKNSYSWAFSTGESIDTCEISGKIFSEEEKTGILIWAFKLNGDKEIDPSEHSPDYSTQTDEKGEFRLEYLSGGIYRLFAVNDINNNLKYDIQSDYIGIPCCDLKLTDNNERIENFFFTMAMEDTSDISITARNKPLTVERISFAGAGDNSASEISYHLVKDSLMNIPPDTKIEIRFNQAVDTLSLRNGFAVIDIDENMISGNIFWKDPLCFVFSPLNSFGEKTGYSITIDSSLTSAINGNKLSKDFNLYFQTGERLSFGSISGEIKNINENIIIELYNSQNKDERIKKEISNTGKYIIDFIKPGEYTIFAFVDTDRDIMYTNGKSYPFQPSERFTFRFEPVIVRSGWDNEDIDIIFYNYK